MSKLPTIDVHTHVVPETFPPYAGTQADIAWPSMSHIDCGHAQVLISGRVYREVDRACWSVEDRVADMDRDGIGRQVLSPMPELLSYWLPAADTRDLSRWLNEQIAEMVRKEPVRFIGLGTVPLQDPELAARELRDAVVDYGLAGVEVGSNVAGRPIGDPFFEPFFAAAGELGAAVFVHALRPTGMERLVGPAALEQVVAFPGETALAAASLITGGMLERHGRVRIGLSHGGGGLGLVLPRLEHAWRTVPVLSDLLHTSPRELARRLYYDTLVYDAGTLRFLLDCFGTSQLMLGTDYPFPIRETAPLTRIAELELSAEVEAALLAGNARRFLALD